MAPGEIRQRSTKKKSSTSANSKFVRESSNDSDALDTNAKASKLKPRHMTTCERRAYWIGLVAVTVLAIATRFALINHPDEVVFDEVHFGKFASYYLQRTYFFDLHPPFAKLLLALVGWLVGYNGDFKFENIGESYITNRVPYLAYRGFSAMLGALTVPVVYLTLQYSGYSLCACLIGAALILFDNAHVAEVRLILLDSTLILAVACSFYSYVRFSRHRDAPYSRSWWKWLLLTGVSLSCVISTKYVGVFTYCTIGVAVILDLWSLMDIKKGLTLKQLYRHTVARFMALIFIPFLIYLFWFWIHFAILTHSGPGDGFMSAAFQETLGDNILLSEAVPVYFYDTVRIKNKETKAILYSWEGRYPLRYDDGRVSSQGQQVVATTPEHEKYLESFSEWVVLPEQDIPEDQRAPNSPVYRGQIIRLWHKATDTMLLTHDVASPYYPTNEEFTTVDEQTALTDRRADTLFELTITGQGVAPDGIVNTKGSMFNLIHKETRVMMWSHSKPLPDWGQYMMEVNGNKAAGASGSVWYFDEIVGLSDSDPRLNHAPRKIARLPFFNKWWELQLSMFAHNNLLTSEHPYASEPQHWPLLSKGVSFWTQDSTRAQIYFIGNFFGWWLEACLIAAFVGVVLADQLTRRRHFFAINEAIRSKLYNSMGFFFIGWSMHYFPFFLMGRQKFLHHYLSAHLAGALLAGASFDLLVGQFLDIPRISNSMGPRVLQVICVFVCAGIVACYLFFAPLTYGWPGLTKEQISARQLMNVELHYK